MATCTCTYTHGIGHAPYTRDDDCPRHGDRAYVDVTCPALTCPACHGTDVKSESWDDYDYSDALMADDGSSWLIPPTKTKTEVLRCNECGHLS